MKYASLPDVEDVAYKAAKRVLGSVIGGSIYKPDTRPMDSTDEDVVVRASAGTVRQFQEFSVYINAYTNDIYNKSKKPVMNRRRLEELAEYEEDIIQDINDNNSGIYEAELESPTRFQKVHDINQSFVSFNLNIKCITFNNE